MTILFTPLVLALAQAAAPAPAAPPLPDLTLEQASALRCSVAFGLVHQKQRAGDGSASDYPVMAQRGQEFFVRTTARLMDETGADRETVMALVMREHAALGETPGRVDDVMPACLLMLDASGL
ncbi:hypothetical protein [Qipengyuania flava]|uniref:hypothetical protein n=1 Tax=Qipengyuania flava TaxID=192812 RepID=UPI00273D63F6|nr:hypothetical protein [Qipengyuania flava]